MHIVNHQLFIVFRTSPVSDVIHHQKSKIKQIDYIGAVCVSMSMSNDKRYVKCH